MDTLKRIIQLRDERGWSNYRLAKEADISQTTLRNIFNRNTLPGIPTLESICKGYGITGKLIEHFFPYMGVRFIAINDNYDSQNHNAQGKTTTPNYKVRERTQKDPGEWVRVAESHEAIITAGDFALVASLLKKDTRIGSGEEAVYLFSGMLFCGDCGENLIRKYVPGKDGMKYVCLQRKQD